MGTNSQRKGRAGELELTKILRAHGYDVSPGIPVSYGQTPDLVGLPGVHIECKRVERLNVGEAMEQAGQDAEFFQDGAPDVFHRRNRSPWLVTMRLGDWLISALRRLRLPRLESRCRLPNVWKCGAIPAVGIKIDAECTDGPFPASLCAFQGGGSTLPKCKAILYGPQNGPQRNGAE